MRRSSLCVREKAEFTRAAPGASSIGRAWAAAVLALLYSGCASAAIEDGSGSVGYTPATLIGGCGPAPGLVPLYVLPYAIGQAFELTQGNCAGTSHDERFRYAFDFRMPAGTAVLAGRAGEVVTVRADRPDGTNRIGDENIIIVGHEDGQFSRYIHLLMGSARVAVGDRVMVRDTLASSGNSGRSRFPHLHFDVASGCDTGRCVTIPSAFRNAVPPIPNARQRVPALAAVR